jgi:outer membrane protein OmpA-like peptidoglycan-associated protein
MGGPMRRSTPILAFAFALACAGGRAAAPDPLVAGEPSVLHEAELPRVRCLVVAPLENTSDAPNAGETATAALVSGIDAARVRVMPIADLRALFRDTPLELPQGIGPSLALELAELVGADAVLYGSVEGRTQEISPELLVTLRLSLASDHRLLFAKSVLVTPVTGERADSSVRRAVLGVAGPAFTKLGDAGRKRCFDPERTKALRKLALAEAAEARAAHAPAPPPLPLPPPPAGAATAAPSQQPAAAAVRAAPGTSRQGEWAKRLEAGDRIVLDDVAFQARTSELVRDGGLADLAAALAAQPGVSVRLEGFVDATSDRPADHKLSFAMARAAADRLAQLGVARQRVAFTGRGGEGPRLPNFTVRGRAANRRVEAVGLR